MRSVAQGVEAMDREEAARRLRMAMHPEHPRQMLTALRFLPFEPRIWNIRVEWIVTTLVSSRSTD